MQESFETTLRLAFVNVQIEEATKCQAEKAVRLHNLASETLSTVPKSQQGPAFQETQLRLDSLNAFILHKIGPYWANRLGLN